jgi:hypothetical protein
VVGSCPDHTNLWKSPLYISDQGSWVEFRPGIEEKFMLMSWQEKGQNDTIKSADNISENVAKFDTCGQQEIKIMWIN